MKTKRVWTGLLASIILASTGVMAFADDAPVGETKAAVDGTTTKANSVPGAETVDELITNNNLRALSGSTSRWSVASQFNYNGGTISNPFSQDRPNISGASGNTVKADLDGSISAKYNLNPTNALMAGFGIRWIAPLSTGSLVNYNGTVFDAMNPYVQYQYIYKWAGIQSVLQVSLTQWTQADYSALGYGQQIQVDQENMYEIGKTGLSIGASIWAQYQFFNKSGSLGTPGTDSYIADITSQQSVYEFGIAPELEYQISSRFNLRTLISPAVFEHYGNDSNALSFQHDGVYQSVGVGISVTRDIFLYPNIQFLPGQLQANLTNLGLGATINLF